MGISGSVIATCKKCKCKFTWNLNSFPFVDSEIIGTCDKCINEETHDCYDELQLDENNCFVKVGRKEFNPPTTDSEES